MLGLWKGGKPWITETAMIFGTVLGILAVSAASGSDRRPP